MFPFFICIGYLSLGGKHNLAPEGLNAAHKQLPPGHLATSGGTRGAALGCAPQRLAGGPKPARGPIEGDQKKRQQQAHLSKRAVLLVFPHLQSATLELEPELELAVEHETQR